MYVEQPAVVPDHEIQDLRRNFVFEDSQSCGSWTPCNLQDINVFGDGCLALSFYPYAVCPSSKTVSLMPQWFSVLGSFCACGGGRAKGAVYTYSVDMGLFYLVCDLRKPLQVTPSDTCRIDKGHGNLVTHCCSKRKNGRALFSCVASCGMLSVTPWKRGLVA